MIITSLLTKFHQNPTSSLWEILLTNKQTNRHTKDIAISRFSRDNKKSIIKKSNDNIDKLEKTSEFDKISKTIKV